MTTIYKTCLNSVFDVSSRLFFSMTVVCAFQSPGTDGTPYITVIIFYYVFDQNLNVVISFFSQHQSEFKIV